MDLVWIRGKSKHQAKDDEITKTSKSLSGMETTRGTEAELCLPAPPSSPGLRVSLGVHDICDAANRQRETDAKHSMKRK